VERLDGNSKEGSLYTVHVNTGIQELIFMIKVGIIGGSGLTGRELIRIILRHAKASISYVTSRHYAGTKVSAVFPEFASMYDGSFIDPSDPKVFSGVDAVFVCLPHTEAMEFVNNANGRGIRVIDLSADYRIKDAKVYETWYKQPHKYPELLKRAVYGMPEINREAIRKADIVANTGCYANCTMLGVLPALSKFKVESIISDAKSGVSGAGIKAKDSSMYININENDTPYSVGRRHRHVPEIEEVLESATGKRVPLIMTPQLVPVDHGMLATIYMKLKEPVSLEDIKTAYAEFYNGEPFIRMQDVISMHNVVNTNFCDIKVEDSGYGDTLLVVSTLDNLIKGASGNAVQNMNIMFGFDEKEGFK
jgi:N-acetyl-gamma-glutamyl-phosphate reductase